MEGKLENSIKSVQITANVKFSELYTKFLMNLKHEDGMSFDLSGVYVYGPLDLIERNTTYEVAKYDKNHFLIGQDGDIGYFINAIESLDESIYEADLGALGSIEMEKIADNIDDWLSALIGDLL